MFSTLVACSIPSCYLHYLRSESTTSKIQEPRCIDNSRSAHLQNLTPRIDAGFWSLGGALLNEPAQEGKALDIKGSAMLANAATKEEVIEELKKDIYSTGGVWNWDEVCDLVSGECLLMMCSQVVIYPFKAAFIKGQ